MIDCSYGLFKILNENVIFDLIFFIWFAKIAVKSDSISRWKYFKGIEILAGRLNVRAVYYFSLNEIFRFVM